MYRQCGTFSAPVPAWRHALAPSAAASQISVSPFPGADRKQDLLLRRQGQFKGSLLEDLGEGNEQGALNHHRPWPIVALVPRVIQLLCHHRALVRPRPLYKRHCQIFQHSLCSDRASYMKNVMKDVHVWVTLSLHLHTSILFALQARHCERVSGGKQGFLLVGGRQPSRQIPQNLRERSRVRTCSSQLTSSLLVDSWEGGIEVI